MPRPLNPTRPGGMFFLVLSLCMAGGASAQTCEQLCRSDPTYRIMNQQRCLHAKLTGRCDSSTPMIPGDPGPPSVSTDRPNTKSRYYRSLGLPGGFEAMPPAQKRFVVEGRAQELLVMQKQTMNQIDSLMRIRPQDAFHEQILRRDLGDAYRQYDQTNRQLQELRRVYEGDIPR